MSYLIVALDEEHGIGLHNDIPWKHTIEGQADMQYFRKITMGGALIMGYNTYLSIGRALPGRINIVVTKTHYQELKESSAELVVFDNLHAAVKYGQQFETKAHISVDYPAAHNAHHTHHTPNAAQHNVEHKCFIIGGSQIYEEYLSWYNPKTIYISRIQGNWGCDKKFPAHLLKYNSKSVSVGVSSMDAVDNLGITYEVLENHNIEETAYLDLFKLLLEKGHNKTDRTGTGTVSYFSPPNLEFNLRDNNIPILTTKTVAMKTGVIPELLWFISGSTDTTELEKQGCHIWRGNTSREFLDSRGLRNYRVGELGPGYGFQWRHAGETYMGLFDDLGDKIMYEGKDQLAELVLQLKGDPDSRRMMMVSWAPAQLDQVALPPCHVLYQVYTYLENGVRYLSAKMYQRSADSFLGVPFNIASYALLTHILAHLTGHVADRIVFTYGDYHIYNTHAKQVAEQQQRTPRSFPKIRFMRTAEQIGNINNVTAEDLQIIGYNPYPKISAPMAI